MGKYGWIDRWFYSKDYDLMGRSLHIDEIVEPIRSVLFLDLI
jgi:hypothetical protein